MNTMANRIVLAKSVEEQYRKWQKEPYEKTGYAIAFDNSESLDCLISLPAGSGSSTAVEGDLTILNDLMYRFLRKHPDAKVLPVHSHPIECLSSRDEKTLRTLAKFKLNYALVVTPTTING